MCGPFIPWSPLKHEQGPLYLTAINRFDFLFFFPQADRMRKFSYATNLLCILMFPVQYSVVSSASQIITSSGP